MCVCVCRQRALISQQLEDVLYSPSLPSSLFQLTQWFSAGGGGGGGLPHLRTWSTEASALRGQNPEYPLRCSHLRTLPSHRQTGDGEKEGEE